MASAIYGEDRLADKTPDKKLIAAAEVCKHPVHPIIVSYHLVSHDRQVALPAKIDELGTATPGERMTAPQAHVARSSALIWQAELGFIAIDRRASSSST